MKKTKTFLKGLLHGAKYTGMLITNIINTVLLLIIYFIGVGTAALFTRITKQKELMPENKNNETYYNEKKTETEDIQEYYKQY